MPDIIERTAKLFEAGNYPDKGIDITTDALDAISSNFTSIPVKVEHSDTPFDGALGNCTKVWRDGNDLKGVIGFSPEAWQLIDKAGAKKLSIGIKRDLSALTEVSLVKNPRIETAAVFDDRIEVTGNLIDTTTFSSWQGLTADDIEEQVKQICKPAGDNWCYIEELGQDYVVVETSGMTKPETYTKYPYSVVDKKVVLGTGEPVEKQTKWITANMSADPINSQPSGGNKMAEIANVAPTEGVATFTDEQKSYIDKMLKEVRTSVEAQFSNDINALKTQNQELVSANRAKDIQFRLDEMKRAGKLTPACEPMAKVILMSGSQSVTFADKQTDIAEVFSKFIDALPELVKFGEQGKNDTDVVNYTAEEIKYYEKITGHKPGEAK